MLPISSIVYNMKDPEKVGHWCTYGTYGTVMSGDSSFPTLHYESGKNKAKRKIVNSSTIK